MADIYAALAQKILALCGGAANIAQAACCMTRLRITLKDKNFADLDAVKKLDMVKGVVYGARQAQIILGAGVAAKTAAAFNALLAAQKPQSGAALKEQIKQKNQTPFKLALRKLADIFIPLIPAFIGCGLILSVNNILIKYNPAWAQGGLSQIFAVMGGAVNFGLSVFVGVNAAKEFGGSPVIGGVMAVILTNPALAGTEFLGAFLTPGRGGIIAVIMVVLAASFLERKIRQIMPAALDLFLTPFLVILITGLFALSVLQPLGGWIADAVVNAVNLAVAKGGFVAGFVLAFGFLPLVMTGLHQGLVPIHAQLIAAYGYTVLFPILAMAGAGQAGAALYVLLKTKNKRLKKITLSALPVGFLGIGEPLIFGVTLPLGRPFLAACIGGGFGGALAAFWGIGSFTPGGISGIPLAPLTTAAAKYLLCLAAGYIGGFAAAWLIGFEDPIDAV
ncbi:MAG: PTS transporter subunit EIIC [Elusimicrobiota bacterium]|jgi:PTS system sucrose-specific IIC component|nr:PTS transporter subunit EIIC [Elusimicrobiota bacterium]